MFDNSNKKRYIYLDGQLIGNDESPSSYKGNSGNTLIGALEGTWWFNGVIDEVRIYNQALSEVNINQNMNTQGLAVVNPTKKLAFTWAKIKCANP